MTEICVGDGHRFRRPNTHILVTVDRYPSLILSGFDGDASDEVISALRRRGILKSSRIVSFEQDLTTAEGEVSVAIVYASGSKEAALEVCQSLVARGLHCLLLMREVDPRIVFRAIEAGVHSIDQSSLPQSYVVAQLDSILRFRQIIGPQVVGALMEEIQRQGQRAFLTRGLSSREVKVVELVGLGLSNREIGARLGVTIGAVNRIVTGIRHALGLASRDDLIRRAHEIWRSPR